MFSSGNSVPISARPEEDAGPGPGTDTVQFVSGTKILNGTILTSIRRNNLIEELPYIGKEFTVSFDLFISSVKKAKYQSILRLTLGRNNNEMGDRIPAIFFTSDQGRHQVIYNAIVLSYSSSVLKG